MSLPQANRPIIIATVLSEQGPTGVQTHFNAFGDWLKEQGEKVCVVTPFQSVRAIAYPLFALRLLIDRVSGSASVWWYRYWHYLFLKKSLCRLPELDFPSVIYAQCPVSAKAALKVKVPGRHRVVMIAHFNISQADEWSDKGKIKSGGRLFQKIRNLEQEILPELDGIVYVSRFMKDKLEARIELMKGVESCVIPNFCPSPYGHDPADLQGDLISIGTLEPRKNQKYLLTVLEKAKRLGFRYKLTLVGDGPDRKMLEQLAGELNIEEDVTFLGSQPNAARFISEHRVYVHSATIESFGIALVEAMSVGRPLLAAPVGGIPEVFTDGIEGFYWQLNDPENSALRLIALLENAELYQSMSNAAFERYKSSFTSNFIGKELHRFLLNKRK